MARAATTRVLRLFPEGRGRSVKVLLRRPPTAPEEACPITSEPIGHPDVEVPYAPAGVQCVLASAPSLTCAQLPCGHRFHATAILVHMMRNGMRCPMCRAGVDALPKKSRLPANETWFTHTSAAVERAHTQDRAEAVAEDRAVAREMASAALRHATMSDLLPDTRVIVWATLWLSDPPAGVRLAGVPIPLALSATQLEAGLFQYHMTNANLREVSRAASGLGAPTLTVMLHATRFVEAMLPALCHVHLEEAQGITPSNPTPALEPPGSELSVEFSGADGGFVLRSFVYRPCRATVAAMFMDLETIFRMA